MNGIFLIYFIFSIYGGGTLATFNSTYQNISTTIFPTTIIPEISYTKLSNHHHHQHHKHRLRSPPSPFTSKGLAIVNRCTIAIQKKSRIKAQEWSDEYLIKPITVQQLKPDILNLPHKIGGLFCRTGVWSEIVDNDSMFNRDESWLETYKIRGTRNVDSRYALMEFYSVAVGLISIRGLETKTFLCMNSRGELYTVPKENYTVECIFAEGTLDNYYNVYTSCAHGNPDKQWHIAFKHSGVPKKGRHISKYYVGAQFIIKELNKNFWIPPQVPETTAKRRNGFDNNGFNWLEKVTNKWQVLTKPQRIEQPSLMKITNIDSKLLDKYYEFHSRQYPSLITHQYTSTKNDEISQKNLITNDDTASLNNDLRNKAIEELSQFMERKKRRMHREERRRKRRRKQLRKVKKYSRTNVARYKHSKYLTERLQNLPTN